jgi:hypothetical protein
MDTTIPDNRTCERRNDMMAFLYEEIDGHSRQDFELHVQSCAECASELRCFKQIRSSVIDWRQQSLGGALASSMSVASGVAEASKVNKPSAMAAIREFFNLSPSWLKASMAFASILFCVLAAAALANVFEKSEPAAVAGDEKIYSEKDLQARIEQAVKSGPENRETQQDAGAPSSGNNAQAENRSRINRSKGRVAGNPTGRRGPLTRSEREQLAADLRLTVSPDETELDLLGEGNN